MNTSLYLVMKALMFKAEITEADWKTKNKVARLIVSNLFLLIIIFLLFRKKIII